MTAQTEQTKGGSEFRMRLCTKWIGVGQHQPVQLRVVASLCCLNRVLHDTKQQDKDGS
jgi:hypothetical protein